MSYGICFFVLIVEEAAELPCIVCKAALSNFCGIRMDNSGVIAVAQYTTLLDIFR